MRWLRLFHIHRDPDFQVQVANAYYECRCGARRTVHYYRRIGSPIRPGWPPLIDRHGASVSDSGWVRS